MALEHECEANTKSLREVQRLCSDFVEFATKCRNMTTVPTTVPTARQRKRTQSNTPKLQVFTFHCFPSNDGRKKTVAPGMSEQERRRRWIAACRLESLNVTRHTRICSKHFEGGLGLTKANPLPTIFDFPKHLQRKEVKQRQDPEARRLPKNTSTTNRIQKACKPGQSKVRKHNESVRGEEIGSQDLLIMTPELHYNKMGDQHLLLEKPQPADLHVRPEKIKEGLSMP